MTELRSGAISITEADLGPVNPADLDPEWVTLQAREEARAMGEFRKQRAQVERVYAEREAGNT